jgi:hypothetical protein
VPTVLIKAKRSTALTHNNLLVATRKSSDAFQDHFVWPRQAIRERLGNAMPYPLFSIFGLTLVFLAFRHSAFSEDFSGIAQPENCEIVLAVAAEGEQSYESKGNPAGGFQWSLKAPEAQLKSASGQVVGKHSAGPS